MAQTSKKPSQFIATISFATEKERKAAYKLAKKRLGKRSFSKYVRELITKDAGPS